MKIAFKIALAALAGLGVAAIDAQAQGPAERGGPAVEIAPLTADQVKSIIEGRLAMQRSDLKVGTVSEKDAKTFDIELLKPDGTVAEHALVDRNFARPAGALQGHGFRHGFGGPGDGPGCDGDGPGKRQGMMGDKGMMGGKGMMGHRGMMGDGPRDTPLTATQVKDILEGQIAWRGEALKVGKVTDKDAATIQAEVLGADGKVVRTVQVDKKTGRFSPVK